MDVKGKRILVCGLARSGLAAARLLAQSGACVTAYDAKDEGSLTGDFDALRALGCRLVFGGDPLELEAGMDLIVISPGIPWKAPLVQAALSNDIEVIGEL